MVFVNNNSVCSSRRGIILVSIPMFSGSMNMIILLIIKIGWFGAGSHLELPQVKFIFGPYHGVLGMYWLDFLPLNMFMGPTN